MVIDEEGKGKEIVYVTIAQYRDEDVANRNRYDAMNAGILEKFRRRGITHLETVSNNFC